MARRTFGSASSGERSVIARCYPMVGPAGQPVCFWAEEGCVYFADERPTSNPDRRAGVMTWPTAYDHLKAFNDKHKVLRNEVKRLPEEEERAMRFIEDMVQVIKQAKEQARKILAERNQTGSRIVVPAGVES